MNEEGSIVSGVAGRYATALFDLAREANSVDQVAGEVESVGALIAENPDLERLVRSPAFSAEQQIRALDAVLARVAITGMTANFVKLVARNRRLFALPEIIDGFARLVAVHRGEVSADVASAHALNAEQQKSLVAALKSSLGKDVKLNTRVDPSLLGGLIVKVGSRMIDTSLRTKLNSLRLAMKEVG